MDAKAERDKVIWDRINAGEPGRWRKDNPFKVPEPIYVNDQPTIEQKRKAKEVVVVVNHKKRKFTFSFIKN